MYKVQLNENSRSYDFQAADFENWDCQEVQPGIFHLVQGNRSLTFRVLRADYAEKTFLIANGENRYTLRVQDQFDLLAEKLGFGNSQNKKSSAVKAPMPGLVRSIVAQVGQSVQKGDTLLILEAMKMENAIKAPHDGVVAKIPVKEGQAVEKQALLIAFE